MSIGNKYVSYYKCFKPPPQKKKPEDFHMRNATAEEIFQMQKINIKSLENKVAELGKEIKELKIENKNLCKANTLQEKELKKTCESSSGISSLMRSYKEEIRAFQSKVSSLQDQLRSSENNLKLQERSVSRKNQQIEKLSTAKRQNERLIKDINLENRELKCEKEKVVKECKKLCELNEELQLKNKDLQQRVEKLTNKISELEVSSKITESNKSQLQEDLNQLQKSYDKLEKEVSVPKPLPILAVAETQTDKMISKSNLYYVSDVYSKDCIKKNEINSDTLKVNGDYWVDDEDIKMKEAQGRNSNLSSDNICKTKYHGSSNYQNELISNLPPTKTQKSLLKPIKSRTPFPLKVQNKEARFYPSDSSCNIKPFFQSSFSASSNFSQTNYSTKNAKATNFTLEMF